MIVHNHTKLLLYLRHLCFINNKYIYILIEKLCHIVKKIISEFYNNLKIMSKVALITLLKTKDTLK